ncbi:11228_t:CDS:1, partial [Dentiscutata erythropus]
MSILPDVNMVLQNFDLQIEEVSIVDMVFQKFGLQIEEVKNFVLEQCRSAKPSDYVELKKNRYGRVPRPLNSWMIFKTDFHKKLTKEGLYKKICNTFNIPGKERLHIVVALVKRYWDGMDKDDKDLFKKLANKVEEEMKKRVPDYKGKRTRKISKNPFRPPYDPDYREKRKKETSDSSRPPYMLRSDKKEPHPKKMQDENLYLLCEPYSSYLELEL